MQDGFLFFIFHLFSKLCSFVIDQILSIGDHVSNTHFSEHKTTDKV